MRATHALNGVGLLLVLWQAGTWLFAPPRYILPSPADVAGAFLRQPGFLFGQAMVTLSEMALGLAAGIAAGQDTGQGIKVMRIHRVSSVMYRRASGLRNKGVL